MSDPCWALLLPDLSEEVEAAAQSTDGPRLLAASDNVIAAPRNGAAEESEEARTKMDSTPGQKVCRLFLAAGRPARALAVHAQLLRGAVSRGLAPPPLLG